MLDLKPIANHIFVSIPSRYEAPKGPRSPEGLGITLLSGEDCMKELEAAIRSGSVMQIETESERSVKNLVRVGQVLQVPSRLDKSMVLCAGGPKGYRTFADITPTVEVGDTVFLDVSALIPDNDGSNPHEILPGIYRLPYSAVICVITKFEVDMGKGMDAEYGEYLTPVGGYVLLERVWSDDVKLEFIDGELRKCYKDGDLISAVDVAPLPNEGIVASVGTPLKGTLNEIQPGQRVIIKPGHGITETIAGTDYLCVRQDYILAVLGEQIPQGPADFYETEPFEFIDELFLLPLHHPAYNA